jgi:diguanylate cyclase (GGDEF)-like protein/PAS domain S-box-containing protein
VRGHELPYDGAVARSAWRNPVNWISEFSLSGFTRGGIVGVRDVSWLARSWADALAATGCTTVCGVEFEPTLRKLVHDLHAALWADAFSVEPAYAVGGFLADHNVGNMSALETTVGLIGRLLPMLPAGSAQDRDDASGVALDSDLAMRIDLLQGAIAAGYVSRSLGESNGSGDSHPTDVETDASGGLYEKWFRSVFRSAGVGMSIASLDGKFVEVNQAAADLLGYTVDELCSLSWAELLDDDTASPSIAAYRALLEGDIRYIRMEQQYRRKDGALIWTNLTASLIRDDTGTPVLTVAMVEDITEARLLREKLRHQASHDPLTGLPNRTLFFNRLSEALHRAVEQPDARVGLCYIDLDRFKTVNDALGHSVGDEVLVAVAERLRAGVGGTGTTIARMGGDEFVILVEPSAAVGPIAAAKAALEALASPVNVGGNSFSVSASIGVVERSTAGWTPQELMAAADMTLYWAKEHGGGKYEVFDPERSAREAARIGLAADLPEALRRNEFRLEYQPLVDLADHRLLGVEALVRWHHPRLGLVPPGDFISLAEETGTIVQLGRWVLAEACRQAAAWAEEFPEAGNGSGLFVSVNLAARQIRDSALVDDVRAILDRTGLPASLLQLELTENEIMDTAGRPLKVLEELAELGIGIAIDDFGTGYSNLSYLRCLPVTSIKVDKSFVDGLGGVEGLEETLIQEKIFGTIVSLAHALNLTVTAEGVERAVQAANVRRLGCDAGQGWLFSRPCTAEKITHVLTARTGVFPVA